MNIKESIVIIILITISGCIKEIEPPVKNLNQLSGSFIVVFDDKSEYRVAKTTNPESDHLRQTELVKDFCGQHKFKADVGEIFSTTINGFKCETTLEEVERIKKLSNIKSVERDYVVTLSPMESLCESPPLVNRPQSIPYGIERVNGVQNYTGSNRAWIIDTGIDLDHPDLNVSLALSRSFVTTENSPNDEHGHGSHVAGIIGAINNNIGVIGVAPGVEVVAIKALNKNGTGTFSTIIIALEYIATQANAGDIINLSVGGAKSSSIEEAIKQIADLGIIVCISAGNSGLSAKNFSPASVNGTNIYTISAINQSDTYAGFSNYGNPPIDYAAPGVSVISTWKNGTYATVSGTSMASPHAGGVFLLGAPKKSGYAKSDPDGNPDPIISH